MPNIKKKKTKLHLFVKTVLAAVIIGYIIFSAIFIIQTLTKEKDTYAKPIFTSATNELAQVAKAAFTQELFTEATTLEPLLKQRSTQVHLGFWSGSGNHGNLVKLIDAINNYKSPDGVINKAIWDEGSASSLQYPAYVTMNRQGWYERAYPIHGEATIFGVQYRDPNPLTPTQADEIWGTYSQRYADTARLFKQATGKTVEVWCFVQGAKKNRIFYTYELPELQQLEKEGYVTVHFAKKDDANWQNSDDWITGTMNAPQPLQ